MMTLFNQNKKCYNQNDKILYRVSQMALQAALLIVMMELSKSVPGRCDRHAQLVTVGNFEII